MNSERIDVVLPDLGDVEQVRVVQWLHHPGEALHAGDDLLEVETEKTTFVVPAPVSGRLVEIIAAEGTTIERGALLGRIERTG